MTSGADPRVQHAAEALAAKLGDVRPRVAIVLGSGLGALAGAVTSPTRVPYGEIEGFPDTLIVTNAAGGLRSTFRPPLLMLIADHLNLMWRSPLMGPVQDGEERFPDMSQPYDRALRVLARQVARESGVALDEGVYAGLLGPTYETPAEIRMLQRVGADAVGMSTVPEVIAARALGLRVLGISSITNAGAGLTAAALSHEEVLEAGRQLAADLERLVRGVVSRI